MIAGTDIFIDREIESEALGKALSQVFNQPRQIRHHRRYHR